MFEAWTSAEVMKRWFHAGHDWDTTEASVDLRVSWTRAMDNLERELAPS